MRVTQSMLANKFTRNLSNSYERMGKYQEQLYTGKKISRPSDDPVVAVKAMNYRSDLTEIKQYQRNVGEIQSWMNNTDASLDEATNVLHRLRDLAVQITNDTNGSDERSSVAEEVSELREQLISIANTKVNDKYLFNGTNTGKPRFEQDPTSGKWILGNANDKAVNITLSDGVSLKANADPSKVFPEDLFTGLESFVNDLKDPGLSGDNFQQYIDHIDSFTNDIVNERSSSQEVVATKTLSENEDVDIEKAIMDLMTQENIHRAALSTGAKIIQPTLMDFLR
jgi:flagellar hook-associated protein 3 FlgL